MFALLATSCQPDADKATSREVGETHRFEESGIEVDLRLTPATVQTSDLFQIMIDARFPPGHRPVLPSAPPAIGDLKLRETLRPEEILDPSTGASSARLNWIYEPFLPGSFEVPALTFGTRPLAATDGPDTSPKLVTEPLPFEVTSVLTDPTNEPKPAGLELLSDSGRVTSAPSTRWGGRRPPAIHRGLWLAVLGAGLVAVLWLRKNSAPAKSEPDNLSGESLARLHEIESGEENEGRATAAQLSGLLDVHLDRMEKAPTAESPEGRLLQEFRDVLEAAQFAPGTTTASSSPPDLREARDLLRRFFFACPR